MPERRYHRGVVDREHVEDTSREACEACEPDTLRQKWKGGMRPKSEKLRDRAQRIVSRAAERDEITTGAGGRSAANRAEMPRAARKLEESASKAKWREQRLADMGKRRSRKAADA